MLIGYVMHVINLKQTRNRYGRKFRRVERLSNIVYHKKLKEISGEATRLPSVICDTQLT